MARRPAPLPEPLRGSAFDIRGAVQEGVTASRLRGGDLTRPFAGVREHRTADQAARTPGQEPKIVPIERLARIYAVKMGPAEFFSHATAGVLHAMWLPTDAEQSTVLDVSVRKPARAPRDRGVRGHHLIDRPGLVVQRWGLPTASPVETWCQLATQLRIPDLVVAADSLMTPDRRDPRLVLDRLIVAASDKDRPMSVRLERAAALMRPGVRSAKETELRLLLVAAGLPEPEINGLIEDEHGDRLAECDLVYRRARVVLEYEGDGHRERATFRRDITRYDRLQDLGWRVIRVTQDDLNGPANLLTRVRRALAR